MVYKDSKNAKIIKIFQQEVGALASKNIYPEVTILSYVVKLWAQLGKASCQIFFFENFFEWFYYLNVQDFVVDELNFWVWEESSFSGHLTRRESWFSIKYYVLNNYLCLLIEFYYWGIN